MEKTVLCGLMPESPVWLADTCAMRLFNELLHFLGGVGVCKKVVLQFCRASFFRSI